MYRCSYQLWHVSSRIKLWEPKRVSNGTNTMVKNFGRAMRKSIGGIPAIIHLHFASDVAMSAPLKCS